MKTFIQAKTQVEDFIKETGREPLTNDFRFNKSLPCLKTIQRHFGGLEKFRTDIGMKITNYKRGRTQCRRSRRIVSKAKKYEKEMYKKIFAKYHKNDCSIDVDTQLPYQIHGDVPGKNDRRSDIGITDRVKKHIIFIDFFYPSTEESFGGCIRIKRKKLRDHPPIIKNYTYEILFVCMNPEFTQKIIDGFKIKTDGYPILSIQEFNKKFMIE